MDQKEKMEREGSFLRAMADMEDLAEKKIRIYSRLLTDPSLAEDMEALANRHGQRKAVFLSLLTGEPMEKKSKKSGAGTN